MSDITQISEWLKELRDAAGSIQAAGVRAGATRAREQGHHVREGATVVSVNFRGRRAARGVDQAMGEGMLVEFDRRKR